MPTLRLLPTACCLLLALPPKAQPVPYYAPPLRIPLALSANFAELRSNHLHSGVDFRTGGKEGEPVLAVAQGYVQRVVIRPDGFGRALYLRHPNGTTSVYAHLSRFAPALEEWARSRQYRRQAFTLDVEPDSVEHPVRQGDVIGYSGNSGSSFGPHLHFELRNRLQQPINVMQSGLYSVPDKAPPIAYQLTVYRFDTLRSAALPREESTHYTVAKARGKLSLNRDTIAVSSPCYFGLNLRDQMDGSKNVYGVSRCELRLNDSLIFAYSMSKFSFDETRYANAMLDFAKPAGKFVRLYVAPGNALSVYHSVKNRGLVALRNGEVAKVSITMTDDAGNTSLLTFHAKGADRPVGKAPQPAKGQRVAPHNRSYTYEAGGFKLTLPAGALYEPAVVEVQALGPAYGSASPVYLVKQPLTPPHRAVSVSIKAAIPEALRGKATVVCMSKSGGKDALSTTCHAPYFTAAARSWGYFFVAVDTVPPLITPVNFTPNARLAAGQTHIILKVKDNLTRLKSFSGHIDGAWALFEHDEKTGRMIYEIDPTRVKLGAEHTLTFTATDGVGNSSTFTCRVHF